MITLMMKDLRQTFWPALLAVLLLITPALAWGSSVLTDSRGLSVRDVWSELAACAAVGAVASLLASSSAAGVAFAKERRERTADLIATLPIERWKIVSSKGWAALLVALAPFAVGMVMYVVLNERAWMSPWRHDPLIAMKWQAIAAGWLLLFGLGWGLSSVLRGEVLASAAPVLLLIILAAAIATWWQPQYGQMPFEAAERLVYTRMAWTFGLLGGVGLIGGTVVALRRKSS